MHNSPDETEGRALYRARADTLAKSQIAMGKRQAKLAVDADDCPSCTARTEHWWSYCAMCGWHIAGGALAHSRPERQT